MATQAQGHDQWSITVGAWTAGARIIISTPARAITDCDQSPGMTCLSFDGPALDRNNIPSG